MAINVVRRNTVDGVEKVVKVVSTEREAALWVNELPTKVFTHDGYWITDGDYIFLEKQ